MSYIPKVDDYVIWKKGIEGWVYFKCSKYVTIEMYVRPKHEESYSDSPIHRNDRVLALCYHDQWKELQYVKSRESVHEEKKNNMETLGKITGGESIQE